MSFSISSGISVTNLSRNFSVSPYPLPSPPSIPNYWVSDWVELLLKKIAVNKQGPTVASRWLFVLTTALYNSYQYITAEKTPLDYEYWKSSEKGSLQTDLTYVRSWVERSCQYFVPKLIKDYMNLTLVPLTDSEVAGIIASHTPLININEQSFTSVKRLLDNYLRERDNDGWKLTTTFDGVLPNGNSVIYADNNQSQNLGELSQPNKWTPLQFGASKKNYLTPEWGTKNKGVLPDSDFIELLDITNQLFPSDTQYEYEMKQVQEITEKLTAEQKIIAEFWAGGPGTVTPPGMLVVFLDIYMRSNAVDLLKEIKSYVTVCTALYQASICAWRLKRDHLQARPVQKIRQYEYEKPLVQSWNTKKEGQYWLPYQELNFVTPPFPDFVSGHSSFSSASSKILCYLFETDTINLKMPVINNNIVQYLSPVLTMTKNFSMNNIFILPNRSTIENDALQTSVTLNWNTWNDIARSAGKSRLYGGIHVESSNQGGQLLGSNIADKIWNMMKNI